MFGLFKKKEPKYKVSKVGESHLFVEFNDAMSKFSEMSEEMMENGEMNSLVLRRLPNEKILRMVFADGEVTFTNFLEEAQKNGEV